MYEKVLPAVLDKFCVDYSVIFAPQNGYRNEIWPVKTIDGGMVNVTFFKREPGIVERVNRADSVSGFLDERGMSVRKRLDERLIKLESPSGVVFAGLYNYLSGETIPWEAYTMERIKNLGAAMSDMHFLLSKRQFELLSVYVEYQQITRKMKDYFYRSGVLEAMLSKLHTYLDASVFDGFSDILGFLESKSGQQALHMDFVRGNILFSKNKVCGILDFEKTTLGHPVIDVARTLAFLLVDCKYKTSSRIFKYFLHSGYIKRGSNKRLAHLSFLKELVVFFLLYDFYKFLAHNPYESLSQNQHYIRTRRILLKMDVLELA